MNLESLFDSGTPEEIFILARYAYSVCDPIIDDMKYKEYERYFLETNKLVEYLSRTYDDDPVPVELLKKYDALDLLTEYEDIVTDTDNITPDKSLSIKSVESTEGVREFLLSNSGQDIITMLKLDGWSTQSNYRNGSTVYGTSSYKTHNFFTSSYTRGRKGKRLNISKVVRLKLPANIQSDADSLMVYSEAFVEESYLQTLREKYDKDKYKGPRSSASTLLRTPHDEEDYKHLKVIAFRCDGLNGITKLSDSIDYLEDNGFQTVPYDIIRPSRFTLSDPVKFKQEFLEYLVWFKKVVGDLSSDGMVMEINNLEVSGVVENQYSSRNIAVKFGPWEHPEYDGIVEEIILNKRKTSIPPKVRIKPVDVGNAIATIVGCYSPKILMSEEIKVGSKIRFRRDSSTTNVLVRGRF